jgi:hypothetical protein
MKKFIIPASDYDSDDSDKPVDDGFDAQMDIEREYEDRIEMAARRLAISKARRDQVQAGSIVGDWISMALIISICARFSFASHGKKASASTSATTRTAH